MEIGPFYLKLSNRVRYRREDVDACERQELRLGTRERAVS